MSENEVSILRAELLKLKQENEMLRARQVKARVRRTPNNEISVYLDGRRWPVTLPPAAWKQLFLERGDEIKALAKEMLAEEKAVRETISTNGQAENE
jgi:hypothetical protein